MFVPQEKQSLMKVQRNFAIKSVGLLPSALILLWLNSIACHAIYAIYPLYNVHEIHDSSSAGVKSRIQTTRDIRLTYQE